MPTYEFRCPDGTIVERMFKMSEVPDSIPSPNGDGEAVRLISGGAGLLFKGDGFYITDYGKDGKKDQRKAASTAGESSAASGEKATTSSPSGESGASSPTPPPPKPPTDTKAA
jgi:predicted nucleic acid-binding Zn ribbon protein